MQMNVLETRGTLAVRILTLANHAPPRDCVRRKVELPRALQSLSCFAISRRKGARRPKCWLGERSALSREGGALTATARAATRLRPGQVHYDRGWVDPEIRRDRARNVDGRRTIVNLRKEPSLAHDAPSVTKPEACGNQPMDVEQVPTVKCVEGGNFEELLHDAHDLVPESLAVLALAPRMHVATPMLLATARRAVIDWSQHPVVMVPDAYRDSQSKKQQLDPIGDRY